MTADKAEKISCARVGAAYGRTSSGLVPIV